jgi:predicted glycosyltransferase involved in capsule biosynthesis
MIRLSLIVSVLESYEVVRRQLLHFEGFLPRNCELILVDDGSEPSLANICAGVPKSFAFRLHETCDRRPWTQPRARNIGASLARADRLLFFDIDHIVTANVVETCLRYQGDKLHWLRRPGVLDQCGRIVTDRAVLRDYGFTNDAPSVHANSFMIRRQLFEDMSGYDERFCGRYGGDDVDFNARYARLCAQGRAQPEDVAGEGFVYPDPAKDAKNMFHSLRKATCVDQQK